MSKSEFKEMKKLFIEVVISTDMVFHFKLIEKMSSKEPKDFVDQ